MQMANNGTTLELHDDGTFTIKGNVKNVLKRSTSGKTNIVATLGSNARFGDLTFQCNVFRKINNNGDSATVTEGNESNDQPRHQLNKKSK